MELQRCGDALRDCTVSPSHLAAVAVTRCYCGVTESLGFSQNKPGLALIRGSTKASLICLCVDTRAGSLQNLRYFCTQIGDIHHRPLLVSLHFYSVDVAAISPCISTHHICTPPPVLVMAIWYFPAATMKHLPFRFQQKAAPVTGWSNSHLLLTAVHLFT